MRIDEGVYLLNPKWISLGDDVWIDKHVILAGGPPKVGGDAPNNTVRVNPRFRGVPGQVVIGDRCHISPFCLIQGHGGVTVGRDCGLGVGVMVYSLSQLHSDSRDPDNRDVYWTPMCSPDKKRYLQSPVVIGDNVGIGLHSAVLCGATIESESFLLPFSVARKPIPRNSIAGGNPAVRLRPRFSEAPTFDTAIDPARNETKKMNRPSEGHVQ